MHYIYYKIILYILLILIGYFNIIYKLHLMFYMGLLWIILNDVIMLHIVINKSVESILLNEP